jgi:lipopolysaccharide cholinephosphotransferase
MREISFEESKKVELDILVDVAKFCDEHGLRYSLAYGTLIGAVRHKGFIPWDDDIDITMPRADYNEFLRTYNQEGKFYKAIDPRSSIARHSYVKVIDTRTVKIEPMIEYEEYLGVDIDIFPLDGMPADDKIYDKWYATMHSIYRKYVYGIMTPNAKSHWSNFKLRVRKIGVPKDVGILLDKAQTMHEQYPYEECEYVGALECPWDWKENRVKKELYEQRVEVDFEGLKFKAPAGYHSILTSIYGDYMCLPPEAERVTHHNNETYWKE